MNVRHIGTPETGNGIVGERVSAREAIDACLMEDPGTDVGLVLAGHASALRAQVRRHREREHPGRPVTLRTYWITYEEIVG